MVMGAFLAGIVILIWSVINFLNVPSPKSQEAVLVLAFENEGRGRMFTGEVKEGMTILDALITSSEAGQIALKYNQDANKGVKITGLDDYYNSSTTNKSIAFYLNKSKVSEKDIYKVAIKPGDKIEIQLE